MGTDPLIEAIEAGVMNAAGAHATELFGADQATVLKDLEMLADRGESDAEPLSEAAAWLNRYAKYWQGQFETLAQHLIRIEKEKP